MFSCLIIIVSRLDELTFRKQSFDNHTSQQPHFNCDNTELCQIICAFNFVVGPVFVDKKQRIVKIAINADTTFITCLQALIVPNDIALEYFWIW